ncbi:MAG: 30S ribosomal protein S16 [Patescibacteria group bacterium]|jgi:small subunit ribosomal protein S16|nr:30S ribosomal protein S16 [Patescibacteria group bacterium]
MLMIKLSKVGKTNKKVFRLIISEKGRDPYGRALEILGAYNPYSKELQVKGDRVQYWLSKGAGMTATVNNLLITKEVIEGAKVTASKKGKVNEKRVAQLQAKADKKKASETPAAPEVEVKEDSAVTEEKIETPEEVKNEAEKTE